VSRVRSSPIDRIEWWAITGTSGEVSIYFGNIGEGTVEQVRCSSESEVLGAVFANLTRLVSAAANQDGSSRQ
jgi:hypothetical protein